MKLMYLGPPGAGKGTMAARTKELLGIPHISTGELFRENVAGETPLGLMVKSIMERGDLVPDEITVAMVKERLERPDAAKGFILDGFPRTIPQAEALAGVTDLDHAINFACPEEELIRRLTGRRFCPVCGRTYHITFMPPAEEGKCDDDGAELSIRGDDTLEAVRNRLKVYGESTAPLIGWYRDNGLLRDVDASVAPDEVFDAVKAVLGR
jgi:adenylate kinase